MQLKFTWSLIKITVILGSVHSGSYSRTSISFQNEFICILNAKWTQSGMRLVMLYGQKTNGCTAALSQRFVELYSIMLWIIVDMKIINYIQILHSSYWFHFNKFGGNSCLPKTLFHSRMTYSHVNIVWIHNDNRFGMKTPTVNASLLAIWLALVFHRPIKFPVPWYLSHSMLLNI